MSALATTLVAAQSADTIVRLAAAEDAETAGTIASPLTDAALVAKYTVIPVPAAHPGVASAGNAVVINAVVDALEALGVFAAP